MPVTKGKEISPARVAHNVATTHKSSHTVLVPRQILIELLQHAGHLPAKIESGFSFTLDGECSIDETLRVQWEEFTFQEEEK